MLFDFQVPYTHALDFENLHDEFEKMLPGMKKTFENLKIDTVRKNVNSKNPMKDQFIQENLSSLKPEIFKRLCKLYEKDFAVFGYELPTFEQVKSGSKWLHVEFNFA